MLLKLYYLIQREMLLAYRKPSIFVNPILFNIINISLFPFAFGPSFYLNNNVFPGLIIISMMFALSISNNILFEEDVEDGTLEQLLISSISPASIILAKLISYWVISALPTILILPFLGIFYSIAANLIIGTIIVISISSFAISIIMVFSSLLTYKLKRNIILTSLISFPFSITIIIFSTSAINNIGAGLINDAINQLSIIISFILIFLPIILLIAPLAIL
ncbi:MAG: heme exporter protein CcmB [Alphaproteobacteria bacterium]